MAANDPATEQVKKQVEVNVTRQSGQVDDIPAVDLIGLSAHQRTRLATLLRRALRAAVTHLTEPIQAITGTCELTGCIQTLVSQTMLSSASAAPRSAALSLLSGVVAQAFVADLAVTLLALRVMPRLHGAGLQANGGTGLLCIIILGNIRLTIN